MRNRNLYLVIFVGVAWLAAVGAFVTVRYLWGWFA